MLHLLKENREIADAPDAQEVPAGGLQIEFAAVDFAYETDRQILKNVN